MSNDIEFVDGLIVKAPHERAPDFVKAQLSIKVDDLFKWLSEKHGQEWVNCDIKVAKSGRWYVAVNTYKAEKKEHSENDKARGQEIRQENRARSKGGSSAVGGQELEDDLPFISCRLSDDSTFIRLRRVVE